MYLDLNLLREPIKIRQGMWLEAVQDYCNNFNKIKNVISNVDTESITVNEKTNSLAQNINLKNNLTNLTYIFANFYFLIHKIK